MLPPCLQPVAQRALSLLLLTTAACSCADDHQRGPERPARSPRSAPTSAPPAPAVSGCSDAELKQAAQRTLRGKATYYANSLAGNLTANGERYDPKRLTAAHRTLPFGTRVRVTRTDVPDSPVVCAVINDRGPYSRRGYILDLSRRGAEGLDMVKKGVVPVRIDVLSLGER